MSHATQGHLRREHGSTKTIGMARNDYIVVLGAGIAAALLMFSYWWFVAERDPVVRLLGTLTTLLIMVMTWVAMDAYRQGMPAIPWMIVAAFLPFVGLLAYLIVREFRSRPGRT